MPTCWPSSTSRAYWEQFQIGCTQCPMTESLPEVTTLFNNCDRVSDSDTVRQVEAHLRVDALLLCGAVLATGLGIAQGAPALGAQHIRVSTVPVAGSKGTPGGQNLSYVQHTVGPAGRHCQIESEHLTPAIVPQTASLA